MPIDKFFYTFYWIADQIILLYESLRNEVFFRITIYQYYYFAELILQTYIKYNNEGVKRCSLEKILTQRYGGYCNWISSFFNLEGYFIAVWSFFLYTKYSNSVNDRWNFLYLFLTILFLSDSLLFADGISIIFLFRFPVCP
jgi:hypothetical protein